MRVYISGPMTGYENLNKDAFYTMEAVLTSMGHSVVNPAHTDVPEWEWIDYMNYDLMLLKGCDAIYMLNGWQHSKGARIERRYAKRLGIRELVLQ